jgi:hypothetical protein
MSFLTAMEIKMEFYVSLPMVIKVLVENNLYDNKTKRPTEYAITNKLAKIKRSRSDAKGKIVEYFFWELKHIKNIFPVFTLIEKSKQCQTSVDAYNRICDAFADFRIMLEIELNVPMKGISEAAQAAAIECYFSDPHFFNGLRLLHRFLSPEEAESAKEIILPLANELCEAAKGVNAARAKSNLRAIKIVMQWLTKMAKQSPL